MKGIEIINASAGSGKTYRLTERVVEKLEEGLAPESLMAITFTNKAAAELRERIRSELLKNGRTKEAQRILDGFLGTVNAVCARLLSEYALDAGLSPALDVMPEEDSDRLFKIAISAVIEKHAGSIEPVAKRLSRVGAGARYNKQEDWRDDVKKIVSLSRANQLNSADLRICRQQSWASLRDVFGEPLDRDFSNDLDRTVERAIENLEEIEEPNKGTLKALAELQQFDRMKRRGQVPWSEWVRISKIKTVKESEEILKQVKCIAADVLRHPMFHSDVEQLITGSFECAAEALDVYDAFKQKQGLMDFVDQETKVLDLARGNEAFRASMSERLKQVMVDEFQDTSPIQLALFLELNNLAGRSTWVGDPKQTIYTFRGTDPQLMDEATRLIEETSTLRHSWRSCETLVEFTNAVFTQVFHEMEEDKVRLEIPDERKEEAKGGWIESWQVPKNKEDASRATAAGIRDLLKRRSDLAPKDIAVLCYKHTDCEQVAASLEAIGIRASATQGSLFQTRECQLAMAALRYMHDRQDDIALAEIVSLSPLHNDHGNWLLSLMEERRNALQQWREDALIATLDKARTDSRHWTPLESLEQAINRVDLINTLKSWPNAALRMSNLDLLRGKCVEYLDQCQAHRSAATIPGFITYLKDTEPGRAQGSGEQTVQVSTYHAAKGLEWPVVILTSLDKDPKGKVFGTNILAAPEFDPTEPLANRSIRYWPWPFGKQEKFPELDEILEERKEQIEAHIQARRDYQRLIYVAMTRAREGLIFAVKKNVTKKETKLVTKWLDVLTDADGNCTLIWPLKTGEQTLEIGDNEIPIVVREFSADEAEEKQAVEPATWLTQPVPEQPEYPRARFSPSGLVLPDDEPAEIYVKLVADFGQRADIKGDYDGISLGSAIHGFLGADISERSELDIQEIAGGILKRWGVEELISVSDLLAFRERLMLFIEEAYPEARLLTEWPVTYVNEDNQLMRGWIDMLLELPEGYVVIDHKSYTAAYAEKEAWRYALQLAAYGEAVKKSTGKVVVDLLLHMPAAGTVLKLSQK